MKIALYIACDQTSPSGLRWIRSNSNVRTAGSVAGYKSSAGYWYVTFQRKQIKAHRLVYFLTHGVWPPSHMIIDHRNRVRGDNRPDNLRLATKAQNCQNTKRRSDNTSGYKGVNFHRQYGWWQVTIQGRYLGVFKTIEEAVEVRRAAEAAVFGEFVGE